MASVRWRIWVGSAVQWTTTVKRLPLSRGRAGVMTSSSPSRVVRASAPSTVTERSVFPAKSRLKRDRAWVARALIVALAGNAVRGACQSKSRE